MPFMQIQEKNLHYNLEPRSFPEDILFIHGNLSSNRWWGPTIEKLKSHWDQEENLSGSLSAMEWLGCGKSRGHITPESLQMTMLAKDYIQFCHTAGLKHVHLVTHSTGGLIALYCLLLEPDLFAKALLLDPVGAKGIQYSPEMYQTLSQMKADRGFCASVMAGTVHGAKPEDPSLQELVDDAFQVQEEIWHGVPDALKQIDLHQHLKEISHPVMVLHGEFDTLLPIAESQALAKGLPSGKFKKLKGQGHSTNMENPALMAQEIIDFFF